MIHFIFFFLVSNFFVEGIRSITEFDGFVCVQGGIQ